MISKSWKSHWFIRSLGFVALVTFPMGCGAVGPPIPPEEVGIEAKVRKQEKDKAQADGARSQDADDSVDEKGVELPNFYPIGKR